MSDPLAMQDRRNQYPRPPFPRQPQAEPGLAGRMIPRPDHGGTAMLASREASFVTGEVWGVTGGAGIG